MKQIYAIARSTFHLLFQRGTGWGIWAATSSLAIFIFANCKADGILLHELQLRIRYSMVFSTVLLSLCTLFIACLSIRRDIDQKIMQALTASKLHRYQIWLGKWVGLTVFAWLTFALTLICVSAASFVAIRAWEPDSKSLKTAYSALGRCYRDWRPEQLPLHIQTKQEFRRRERLGLLPENRTEWAIKNDLKKEIRRTEQYVEPDASKTWQFDVKQPPDYGETFTLEYTFFSEERRSRVSGIWTISAKDAPGKYTALTTNYPYSTGQISVPVSVIPPDGKLTVTFEGKDSPHLIFPRDSGIRILCDDGSLAQNILQLCIPLFIHLGAVTATGLAVAVPFTLPVAVFAALVLYLLATTGRFFGSVVEDLTWGDPGLMKTISVTVIRGGISLAQGLRIPPVMGRFSEGISLNFVPLAMEWGGSALIYSILLALLGMILLTRKELDRIY